MQYIELKQAIQLVAKVGVEHYEDIGVLEACQEIIRRLEAMPIKNIYLTNDH
jgi:hypothetical protein